MLSDKERKALYKARDHFEHKRVDAAWEIIEKLLFDHPFERDVLAMAGHVYKLAGNMPIAYHMFRQATEQDARNATNWLNFGLAAAELWRSAEAERAYMKALKHTARDETLKLTLGNLASLCIDNARYAEAEVWARKALAEFPDFDMAKTNLGFAQLAQRNWAEGWKNYRHCLGTSTRTAFVYHDPNGNPYPEWQGEKGKIVVLYGEQGLGDEISFASMVPDAVHDCEKVIIDCDSRLANLFQRSFPQASVYGTRKLKSHDMSPWRPEDRNIDASLAIGQIGEYYRTSAESFHGEPYLVPDPERVLMWKSLWATKGKPVIGIAWNGGIPRNGAKFRKWTLEELLPVLKSVDAHWVSLEYKSAAGEIEAFRAKHPEIDLKEYPHATLTNDYDDTAALVASLDHVFCIQTAVAHLGGALGVPTWVCVPPISQWRYGGEGDSIPWYQSLKVIRQHKGAWNLGQIAQELNAHFRTVPAAARNAA
jgi:tetratricopeptide (TPR) repeat protein